MAPDQFVIALVPIQGIVIIAANQAVIFSQTRQGRVGCVFVRWDNLQILADPG